MSDEPSFLLRQVVHVAPVAVEDQLAVLERLPALLLLPGDGGLRDVTVLEPVGERLQALCGLGSCDVRLAVVTNDDTARTVHGLVEVHRQTLVLVVLAGEAAELGVFLACL